MIQYNKVDNLLPVTFPRLKENECSGLRDIDHEMPVSFKFNALPLKILCTMVIDKEDADKSDFVFLKQCLIEDSPLEYSGFLTSQTCLRSGSSYRKVTDTTSNSNGKKKVTIFPTTDIEREVNGSTIHYRPLINLPPADPSTVLSSMINSQNLANEFGQQHALLTGDQQIHKVTFNVKWQYGEKFKGLYPILGGMHTEISFVWWIGYLMAGSGLAELMKSSFGCVEKNFL